MRRFRSLLVLGLLSFASTASANDHFLAWINGIRAQSGLGSVAHDPNLDAWAASNNAVQASRGLGHFVMGHGGRQNAGMGAYETVLNMWMQSSGHRDAILDPSITHVGIAGNGAWWTFNATSSGVVATTQAVYASACTGGMCVRPPSRRLFGRRR